MMRRVTDVLQQIHGGILCSAQMSSCGGLKEQYDRCFNHWYRHHFLRGDLNNNCTHFFEDYRACLLEELQQKALDRLVRPNDTV